MHSGAYQGLKEKRLPMTKKAIVTVDFQPAKKTLSAVVTDSKGCELHRTKEVSSDATFAEVWWTGCDWARANGFTVVR